MYQMFVRLDAWILPLIFFEAEKGVKKQVKYLLPEKLGFPINIYKY